MKSIRFTTAALGVLLCGSSVRADVPKIAVGPETKDRAPRVDAPIETVTVFSDRARVARAARFGVKAGLNSIRLPDLPGATRIDTVRITAKGARVLRAEALPVDRETISIEQVKGLLDELEAIDDQIALAQARASVEREQLELVGRLQPAAPVSEKDRDGRAALPVSPGTWFKAASFLGEQDGSARGRVAAVEKTINDLAKKRSQLNQKIQQMNLGGFTNRRVEVFCLLESKGAKKVGIELQYDIPGARWKPTYDLRYDQSGRLTVATNALVQQATGEDWNDVELRLSTAIPGQGIDLPELLTWTLGESRDFLPVPRAARRPPAPPRYQPPVARATPFELDRAVELELLQQRFAQLLGRGAGGKRDAGYGLDDVGGSGARPDGAYTKSTAQKKRERKRRAKARRRSRRARPQDRPPSSPAPTVAMEEAVVQSDSGSVFGSLSGAASTPTVYKNLALFERPPQKVRFNDPYLPAVSAGGLDYVYVAPTRSTIPSKAEDKSVPLVSQTFKADAFYEATPSLDATAYVKAKVINAGERPLLRGPTTIFVGGELVGQGELATTGPGGEIGFPLGADENVRLIRTVIQKTVTEGFFSKDDITTYETTIEVGNYKKKAITIEVVDQIPKTRQGDVEVELVKASPKPLKGKPNASGIMRWRVEVGAGKTTKIVFSYKLSRPKDWQLYQN